MGTWGVKIFQDDVACDIKEEYIKLLRAGLSNEEATNQIIQNNKDYICDIDDGPIFWFALADTQWNYGRLLYDVKEKAIEAIDTEISLDRWKENNKLFLKRKKELQKLKEKLNSPQKEEKKVKKIGTGYQCEWKLGDVFAYHLDSDMFLGHYLYGKYVIIIKTGEAQWDSNHIIPVVKLKITKNNEIPLTINEINELEYIQIGNVWASNRNFKKIENLAKDEYGFTPIYELEIVTFSKKTIPRKLIYIDNFKNFIKKPAIEYIETDKLYVQAILWKNLDNRVINSYEMFNLKKSDIYNQGFFKKREKELRDGQKKVNEYLKNLDNK